MTGAILRHTRQISSLIAVGLRPPPAQDNEKGLQDRALQPFALYRIIGSPAGESGRTCQGADLTTQMSSMKTRPAPPAVGLVRLPTPTDIFLIFDALTLVKLLSGMLHSNHLLATTAETAA